MTSTVDAPISLADKVEQEKHVALLKWIESIFDRLKTKTNDVINFAL